MNILRSYVDEKYLSSIRDNIFARTSADPEEAHHEFVQRARALNRWGLDRIMFDCDENKRTSIMKISNAAGFNKNADIPPQFLKYLGFDRVVVGTVTYDPWNGNPRPRIKRYPDTGSIVNWMGLPGVGALQVARNLQGYGNHEVPITMNIMATPQKSSADAVRDIASTIKATRNTPYVDRFELNISCPNTHGAKGTIDARQEHIDQLRPLLDALVYEIRDDQEAYLKVSPNLSAEEVDTIARLAIDYNLAGVVATNTTTQHDARFITSLPNPEKKGGASGNALYDQSFAVQRQFEKIFLTEGQRIIACGGIDTVEKALSRTENISVEGLQIFTPLIFKGPKIIRDIRKGLSI